MPRDAAIAVARIYKSSYVPYSFMVEPNIFLISTNGYGRSFQNIRGLCTILEEWDITRIVGFPQELIEQIEALKQKNVKEFGQTIEQGDDVFITRELLLKIYHDPATSYTILKAVREKYPWLNEYYFIPSKEGSLYNKPLGIPSNPDIASQNKFLQVDKGLIPEITKQDNTHYISFKKINIST